MIKLFATILTLLITVGIAPFSALANDPKVDDILTMAAARLQETETMAFTMELEGTTYVDELESIQLLNAEGVMQRPDMVDVTFTALVLGRQQISIRMITEGDDAWITDIVTGKWVPSPPEFGYNPAILYDDEHGLGPVMGRMQEPEVVGEEEIEGRDAWHIEATVDGEVISQMTSGTMRGSQQDLQLWIAKDNGDILQIRIAEPTDEDIEDPAVWTLKLTDHDEDVQIEKPE